MFSTHYTTVCKYGEISLNSWKIGTLQRHIFDPNDIERFIPLASFGECLG